jgi:uncharacterized protein YwbE
MALTHLRKRADGLKVNKAGGGTANGVVPCLHRPNCVHPSGDDVREDEGQLGHVKQVPAARGTFVTTAHRPYIRKDEGATTACSPHTNVAGRRREWEVLGEAAVCTAGNAPKAGEVRQANLPRLAKLQRQEVHYGKGEAGTAPLRPRIPANKTHTNPRQAMAHTKTGARTVSPARAQPNSPSKVTHRSSTQQASLRIPSSIGWACVCTTCLPRGGAVSQQTDGLHPHRRFHVPVVTSCTCMHSHAVFTPTMHHNDAKQ